MKFEKFSAARGVERSVPPDVSNKLYLDNTSLRVLTRGNLI